ncbi:hypothetical protein WUBG_06932 [Wuchereria bancrofti]|uniref:Uncharacterized protein n=1 Tax=Wuchereria bancrofti TaxID=6293 RepID=J9EY77_WUCBA|nr:hypothetical protein WUBG_06932 [Wuchereria bancrofti]
MGAFGQFSLLCCSGMGRTYKEVTCSTLRDPIMTTCNHAFCRLLFLYVSYPAAPLHYSS